MTTPRDNEDRIREIVREEIAAARIHSLLDSIERKIDAMIADNEAYAARDGRSDNDLAKAPRWFRKRAAGVPVLSEETEETIKQVREAHELFDRALDQNAKLLDMVEANLERRAE